MRTTVDSSAVTHLPVCPCGWRGVTVRTLELARRQAAEHLMERHPADRTTRRAAAALRTGPIVADLEASS